MVNLPAPGTWTIIGINSYTKSKCLIIRDIWLQSNDGWVFLNLFSLGDCSATGLKTRVSAYRDWIDQYMN